MVRNANLKKEKLAEKLGKSWNISSKALRGDRAYQGVTAKYLVPVIPSLVFVHAGHTNSINFKKRYNFLQFMMRKRGRAPTTPSSPTAKWTTSSESPPSNSEPQSSRP